MKPLAARAGVPDQCANCYSPPVSVLDEDAPPLSVEIMDKRRGVMRDSSVCATSDRTARARDETRPAWLRRLFAWQTARGEATAERLYGDRKRALFADLAGTVLEIGPGTGANLPAFPRGIHWIGIEPNPFMQRHLRERASRLGLGVELHAGTAERLPVPDASVDAVVSTLVLCSVADPEAALGEIRRVLKPGGRFIFIEHVAAPRGSRLRRVQQAIRPVWRFAVDGCHPDRETWAAIEGAGFASVHLAHFHAPIAVVGPHIAGVATKQG